MLRVIGWLKRRGIEEVRRWRNLIYSVGFKLCRWIFSIWKSANLFFIWKLFFVILVYQLFKYGLTAKHLWFTVKSLLQQIRSTCASKKRSFHQRLKTEFYTSTFLCLIFVLSVKLTTNFYGFEQQKHLYMKYISIFLSNCQMTVCTLFLFFFFFVVISKWCFRVAEVAVKIE